jgi:sortase A
LDEVVPASPGKWVFRLLVCAGFLLSGEGLLIHGKAVLAQWLIARAWERGSLTRPWPGADTVPVARLRWIKGDVDAFVLDDGGGQSLAFGPSRLKGSVAPGEQGVIVIAGHQDTHFSFLQDIPDGALIELESLSGNSRRYRVASRAVNDARAGPLWISGDALVLVTCFPFGEAAPGGPLRYVVTARPVSQISARLG